MGTPAMGWQGPTGDCFKKVSEIRELIAFVLFE